MQGQHRDRNEDEFFFDRSTKKDKSQRKLHSAGLRNEVNRMISTGGHVPM